MHLSLLKIVLGNWPGLHVYRILCCKCHATMLRNLQWVTKSYINYLLIILPIFDILNTVTSHGQGCQQTVKRRENKILIRTRVLRNVCRLTRLYKPWQVVMLFVRTSTLVRALLGDVVFTHSWRPLPVIFQANFVPLILRKFEAWFEDGTYLIVT